MFFLLRKRESGMRPAEQGVVLLAWMALFLLIDWRGDVGQRRHSFSAHLCPLFVPANFRYRRDQSPFRAPDILGAQSRVDFAEAHCLLSTAAVNRSSMLICASLANRVASGVVGRSGRGDGLRGPLALLFPPPCEGVCLPLDTVDLQRLSRDASRHRPTSFTRRSRRPGWWAWRPPHAADAATPAASLAPDGAGDLRRRGPGDDFLQQKGFTYHRIPFNRLSVLYC